MEDQQTNEVKELKEIIYPTLPAADGTYFETEEDAEAGIKTGQDEKGKLFKRSTLENGDVATVRKLKGKDSLQAMQMTKGNKSKGIDESKYMASLVYLATAIEGRALVMEDYLDMDMADFNKLLSMTTALNF